MSLLKSAFAGLLLMAATVGAQELPTAGGEPLFELSATPQGPLVLPSDVAIGADRRIYVVDGGNNRLVAFDSTGAFLFTVGGRGREPGEFLDPVGIAADSEGRVYVADKGNGRIQVFNADGGLLRIIPVVDGSGPARPVGIVTSADGEVIYVSGNVNHNIMVFDAQGDLLREWGTEGIGPGQFRYPASLALRHDLLYAVDGLNSRVQIFTGGGEKRFRVGEWGVLPGQLFRPKGVAIDGQDRIYVSDGYMDVIQVFGDDFRLQHIWGEDGVPHRFKAPGGIAIDPEGKRLYVAEMLANRISVFSIR